MRKAESKPMPENRPARIVTSIVFLGLLAAPAVYSRVVAPPTPPGGGREQALKQFGFHFEEVSKKSGIDFVHRAPRLHSSLDPIMPEVASMGAAVSVVDYDRDGWNDLYVVDSGEGSQNRLYRNLGNGQFQNVAAEVGLADLNRPETGVSMGAVWGDYDNDGFEDLYLNKWGRPELFHNDGGKKFSRVTEGSGLPGWLNANSAVWFDYDRDGKLDLFVGGYYRENLNLWRLSDTRIMPDSFEYATNGGRKYLFHNLGNGKFEEVAEKLGLRSNRWALAAAAADLRRTGFPDLFIANDYGVSELFANHGGKQFRDIGRQTTIAERPKSGMNVSFGDVFNQGIFSIYVSNISEEGTLIQGNNLWVPRDGAEGDRIRYINQAGTMGVELGGWSFGAQFGDLNNDGWQDLFLTNGYVSADPGSSYWYDFTKITGANSAIISDAENWPPINNRSHAGYQRKRVWINEGGRRFADVAGRVGVTETFDGRSVVTADLWNRGVLDVVVAHQKGPLLVYKNTVAPGRNWVAFELEGTKSNRSAIGAEVTLYWNGQKQMQQVSGGSGFCAQNQRRVHFGMGAAAQADKVVVRWPSGKEQTLQAPETGKVHRIKEDV